mmetsp:Transcript_3072/g.3607  ORF Transcript_3072/g.3607 Transcript_3072/m.3607 type:complete len:88 (-) Transcript_3072:7-270(-)
MNVKRGRFGEVREALLDDRFLAHSHNEMMQTPLIVAVKRNNLPMVQLLLQFKANPLSVDQNNKSAIYYAMLYGYYDILFYLRPKRFF